MVGVVEGGLGLIVLLLLLIVVLLVARRGGHVNEHAVSGQVVRAIEPFLSSLHGKVQTLDLLPPLKQGVDERLPSMVEVTNRIQVAVAQAQASLAGLTKATETTPHIAQRIAAIETELQRLERLESELRQLTSVFLTAHGKGARGEEAVRALLKGLPTDLWREQQPVGGGKVDFVVRMPNGLLLPIDSKTSGIQSVAAFLELVERSQQATEVAAKRDLEREAAKAYTKIAAAVLAKAREVRGYVQPQDGTLGLAVQAVPDALYQTLDVRTLHQAAELNIHIVPYGLLVPVLNVLRSQNRSGGVDVQALVAAMDGVRVQHRRIQEVLENRFRRAAKVITSGVEEVDEALIGVERTLAAVEARQAPGAARRSVARRSSRQQR